MAAISNAAGYGCGTVFRLTPKGKEKSVYKEKVLYRFGRIRAMGIIPMRA